ncbi:hypothetical protein AWJ20_1482 [Sugiyamaella lignohabitans]|uniref:Fmp27p n=1 Tax=Sugiyamaella lignohabitans TaxID=796027 RepID=A0A167DRB8_9ASCO|nr:uncharacterized protein AWJ20_1482 [Sugiyamaella lignohabitans]ANB13200.1 hypothetical protein AWJ20_1482 [Sugiyamaella lignohabitans]
MPGPAISGDAGVPEVQEPLQAACDYGEGLASGGWGCAPDPAAPLASLESLRDGRDLSCEAGATRVWGGAPAAGGSTTQKLTGSQAVPGAVQRFILSLLGYLLVIYLVSFPVFAIIRVVTGVSIKRLGYFSVRHVSFAVRPGIRIFIGKVGLSFHTPTVARPGWTSLFVSNFEVVIDPKVVLHPDFDLFEKDVDEDELADSEKKPDVDLTPKSTGGDVVDGAAEGLKTARPDGSEGKDGDQEQNGSSESGKEGDDGSKGADSAADGKQEAKQADIDDPSWSIIPPKTVTFYIVRFLLNYARFCSLNINSASVTYTGLTSLVIGNLQLKADLRNTSRSKSNFIGTLDNTMLNDNELPAHCKILVEDFYVTSLLHPTEESREIIESLVVDIDGILGRNDLSLKELSFGFKLGKTTLMIDKVAMILAEVKRIRQQCTRDLLKQRRASSPGLHAQGDETSPRSRAGSRVDSGDGIGDSPPPISPSPSPPLPEKQQVDSQGILSDADIRNLTKIGTMLIRVVKEVEFKATYVGLFGIANKVDEEKDSRLGLAVTARDFSLDLRRLNPDSPGFKLLFSPSDSAHQAVMTISSITCGVDYGTSQEEFLYAPLVTLVSKTNIFSRTLRIVQDIDLQYNENILRANINISDPTVNLGTEHVPMLLRALAGSSKNSSKSQKRMSVHRSSFQRLYPRALIKFTINEPAARIVLDSKNKSDNPGMVISSASKVYCDFESSHSKDYDSSNYNVNASLQVSSFATWYRSPEGERHDIMLSESIFFKVMATTLPCLSVVSTAKLSNAHILLTKYEIIDNLREVAIHFKKGEQEMGKQQQNNANGGFINASSTKKKKKSHPSNILADLPPWCSRIKFEVADTAVTVASEKVRRDNEALRGLTIKMANSIVEYRGPAPHTHPEYPPRTNSITGNTDRTSPSSSTSSLLQPDKRRLSLVMDGIEGYKIVEPYGMEQSESTRFLSIPTVAVALASVTNRTSHHNHDHTSQLQLNVVMRQAVISYDINLHFLGLVLRDLVHHVFAIQHKDKPAPAATPVATTKEIKKPKILDFVSIHFRSENTRIKVKLVNDIRTMLELNSVELIAKPHSNPTITANLIRLYAIHPHVRDAWCIVMSLRGTNGYYDLDAVGEEQDKVILNFDAMRMNMPYQFIYYHIFDNIISLVKAIQNLHKQFETKNYYLVIKPKERDHIPNIPRVRVRSPAFIISLEDDHFESELGMIFQLGLLEQKVRMSKQVAFDEKMQVVCNSDLYKKKNGIDKKAKADANTDKKEEVAIPDEVPTVDDGNDTARDESELDLNSNMNSGINTPIHTNGTAANGHSRTDSFDFNPKRPKKHHTHLGAIGGAIGGNIGSAVGSAAHSNAMKSLHNAFHVRPNRHRKANYKLAEATGPSASCCVSFEHAKQKLLENFSTSWIHLYNEARRNRVETVRNNIEKIWGKDNTPRDTVANEKVIDYSDDPLLFLTYFKGMDLVITKPKFDRAGLAQYLHDIGKGMPLDSKFSLLIPLYIDLKLGELSMELRDYPLPLLHFPELQASQNPKTSAVSLCGHFITAEELSIEPQNIRRIMVPLIPTASIYLEDEESQKYVLEVNRTVASVKMYTDMNFEINSFNPTRITWGQSIQPALQTVMMGFDSFSKPPIDQSPKLGFWDKIRAVFHSRIKLKWNGGDVYLLLKGSRSPYDLLKGGAGFVFAWRNQVSFSVNGDDDPKKFMVTDSQEFVWGVPSYVHWEREYFREFKTFNRGTRTKTNYSEMNNFQKVILKLSGQVQWKLGLLFEQDLIDPNRNPSDPVPRTNKFRPHYDVKLSLPSFIYDLNGYDAYRGFRSQYLHLALSVSSGKSAKAPDVVCYNTAHLSSMTFKHFKEWWALFDGSLSLPIRAGKLFQPTQLIKPKFGRHVSSVQYKLEFSPLFVCHTYRHPNSDNLEKCTRDAATGLKAKIDNFTMDLHQRRQPVGSAAQRWRMKMNLGELDFKGTDLRVICAEFKEKSPEVLLMEKNRADAALANNSPVSSITDDSGGPSTIPSSGEFNISDNDYTWIDLDDFSEMGEIIPVNSAPKVSVLPLMYSPRWTYFRQTDHSDEKIGVTSDGKSYYKFGDTMAHDCLIGKKHPEVTQAKLLKARLDEITEQLKTNDATLDSLQRDLERFPNETKIIARIKKISEGIENLNKRRAAIKKGLEGFDIFEDTGKDTHSLRSTASDGSFFGLNEIADVKSTNVFSNRFIIHNVLFIWNNANRNAVYRYVHRLEIRRQMSYYVTRRAVKYVEELIESQSDKGDFSIRKEDVEKILEEALGGGQNSSEHHHGLDGDSKSSTSQDRMESFNEDLHHTAKGLDATDTYLVRLISPQIQLVSEQNPDQCLLIASRNLELKVLTIEDTMADEDDDMARTVETRYGCMFDDALFFVLNKEEVLRRSMFTFGGTNYGSKENNPMWPPWLSVECCFDSRPLEDALVVERTSVAIRYDKPNSLYVQRSSSTPSSMEDSTNIETSFCSKYVRSEKNRANRIAVDFPRVIAKCDSDQYFAVYSIVVDLLVYSEPVAKQTTERLERMMLTTDFRDMSKAAERLTLLQKDIYRLYDLREEFYIRHDELDENGLYDLLTVEVELRKVFMELVVIMQAIKSGLQKHRKNDNQYLKWAVASDEIIWHALGKNREPFLDIGLADASFNRIEGSDGFNSNTVEVGMMQGFHLSQNSLYPEVFAPFNSPKDGAIQDQNEKLISVKWTMLDPIGGIPIMELFQVRLQPLKLQLEHQTGKEIFSYVFPSNRSDSPFIVPQIKVKESSSNSTIGSLVKRSTGLNNSKTSSTLVDNDDTDSHSTASEMDSLKDIHYKNHNHRQYLAKDHESVRSMSTTVSGSTSILNSGVPSVRNTRTSFTSSHSGRQGLFKHDNSSNTDQSIESGHTDSSKKKKDKKEVELNDVSTMIKRASNYMSIVDIDIASTVLCVSYKASIVVFFSFESLFDCANTNYFRVLELET